MPVLIARHGEREDYVDSEAFLASELGKERPWDPRLTKRGREQGRRLGVRVAKECEARGWGGVKKVYASPFIRTVETAEEAGKALGLDEILVEDGVVESLCEEWFRSWAVPGADTAWGGPPHSRSGVPVETADLHHLAHKDPSSWLLPPTTLKTYSPFVSTTYTPLSTIRSHTVNWHQPEFMDTTTASRLRSTLHSLHARHPEETILVITHGGPATGLYYSLTGLDEKPMSAYTSLFAYHPKVDSPWECVIAGCNKHADDDEL